jgi:hypothetical protein
MQATLQPGWEDSVQTIPGISDYGPEYYAITVVGWIVIVAVVGGVAVLLFRLVRENYKKTAASGVQKVSQVAHEVVQAINQHPARLERSKKEEEAYEIAAEEIEKGLVQKGLWAKALADANGDEKKQHALYLRYRAEQLMSS